MVHISCSGKDTPLLHQPSGFSLKLLVALSRFMIYLVYLSSEHGGAVGQKETQQLAVFGTQGKLTVSRQPLGQ